MPVSIDPRRAGGVGGETRAERRAHPEAANRNNASITKPAWIGLENDIITRKNI
jgi:hypothetical protein